jgi:hypothetical protein
LPSKCIRLYISTSFLITTLSKSIMESIRSYYYLI